MNLNLTMNQLICWRWLVMYSVLLLHLRIKQGLGRARRSQFVSLSVKTPHLSRCCWWEWQTCIVLKIAARPSWFGSSVCTLAMDDPCTVHSMYIYVFNHSVSVNNAASGNASSEIPCPANFELCFPCWIWSWVFSNIFSKWLCCGRTLSLMLKLGWWTNVYQWRICNTYIICESMIWYGLIHEKTRS